MKPVSTRTRTRRSRRTPGADPAGEPQSRTQPQPDTANATTRPANVAIHRVAIAVELGDMRDAALAVPAVDMRQMPTHLTERRARFLIDIARAHAGMGAGSAAIDALTQAEQVAPDEVRSHRLTHDLLQRLMLTERRSSGLRALAERCGLQR
jgi:hypothetical protein